jgi:histidyl-tRNA synthetase
MINPRPASGTRDLLPAQALARERLLASFKGVFERHGFLPIDTPILERREVLYAKGGDEIQRQVFEVSQRGVPAHESDLALRFDLTVPLARYIAAHLADIGTPFKRYHVGIVFRGERAQRGRYREFYQCDFDTVGCRSALADAEILEITWEGLVAAGVPSFVLRLNHRKILDGLLQHQGLLAQRERILRAVDKLDKIGREEVLRELRFGPGRSDQTGPASIGAVELLSEHQARELLDALEALRVGSCSETLNALKRHLGQNALAEAGLAALTRILELIEAVGFPQSQIRLDPALARGLDYYTGMIFEAVVMGYEHFGSVAAGGRYDDLAGLFTTAELPGVGASFGVDRLLAVLSEAGWLTAMGNTAPVLMVNFPGGDERVFMRLARELRAAGIGCELYPEPHPLRDQLGYAAARGYRFALILGPDELRTETFCLRNLTTRTQQAGLPLRDLVSIVAQAVGEASASAARSPSDASTSSAPTTRAAARENESPAVVIRLRANGPLVVEGPIRLLDPEGQEIPLPTNKPAVALCRCGHSKRKPFCDGSHKAVGFQAQEKAADFQPGGSLATRS